MNKTELHDQYIMIIFAMLAYLANFSLSASLHKVAPLEAIDKLSPDLSELSARDGEGVSERAGVQ